MNPVRREDQQYALDQAYDIVEPRSQARQQTDIRNSGYDPTDYSQSDLFDMSSQARVV